MFLPEAGTAAPVCSKGPVYGPARNLPLIRQP